jgi:hypothetical protein
MSNERPRGANTNRGTANATTPGNAKKAKSALQNKRPVDLSVSAQFTLARDGGPSHCRKILSIDLPFASSSISLSR